ncbi:MAG: hypothetical protein ACHQUB_03180 [Candidatus Saccharimonadia bacterium]
MKHDKTISELTKNIKASFAQYDSQGTKHWTWETAMRDLSYQVGSLSKVALQLSGERFDEGKTSEQLQWQLRNELADIVAEVLYIAAELKIDMNEAMAEMLADDTKKITERTEQK